MTTEHADMCDKPEDKSSWGHEHSGTTGNTHSQNMDPDCCRTMRHAPQSVPSLPAYYSIIQPPGPPAASAYIIPMMKTMPLQNTSGLDSGFVLMQSPGHMMSPGIGQFVSVVPMQAISFNEKYPMSGGIGESDMQSGLHQSADQTDLTYSLGPPLASSTPRNSPRQLGNLTPGSQHRPLQSQGKFSSNYNISGNGQFGQQSLPPNVISYDSSGSMSVGSPSRVQRPVSAFTPISPIPSSQQETQFTFPFPYTSSVDQQTPISPIPSSQQETQFTFPSPYTSSVDQQTGPYASRPMSSASPRPLSPSYMLPSDISRATVASQSPAYRRQSTASLGNRNTSYQTVYPQSPASPQSPITSFSSFSPQASSTPQRQAPQPSPYVWNSTQSPRRPDYLTYPSPQQPVRRPVPTQNWTSGYASDSSGMERSYRHQSPPLKLRSQSPPVKGNFQGTYYVSDGQITFNPPLNLSRDGNSSLPQDSKDSSRLYKKQGVDVANSQALPDDFPNAPLHKCVQTPLEWITDSASKDIQTPCGWLGGPTVNEPPNPLQYCSGSCPTSKDLGLRRKKRRKVCCESCKAEMKKRKEKIQNIDEPQESGFDRDSMESAGRPKTDDSRMSIPLSLDPSENATSPLASHIPEPKEVKKTPSTQSVQSGRHTPQTSPSGNLQEKNVKSQRAEPMMEPTKTVHKPQGSRESLSNLVMRPKPVHK